MKNVVAFSPICGSQKKLVLLLMQCLLGNVSRYLCPFNQKRCFWEEIVVDYEKNCHFQPQRSQRKHNFINQESWGREGAQRIKRGGNEGSDGWRDATRWIRDAKDKQTFLLPSYTLSLCWSAERNTCSKNVTTTTPKRTIDTYTQRPVLRWYLPTGYR